MFTQVSEDICKDCNNTDLCIFYFNQFLCPSCFAEEIKIKLFLQNSNLKVKS